MMSMAVEGLGLADGLSKVSRMGPIRDGPYDVDGPKDGVHP